MNLGRDTNILTKECRRAASLLLAETAGEVEVRGSGGRRDK
jgi:hypothetical protein